MPKEIANQDNPEEKPRKRLKTTVDSTAGAFQGNEDITSIKLELEPYENKIKIFFLENNWDKYVNILFLIKKSDKIDLNKDFIGEKVCELLNVKFSPQFYSCFASIIHNQSETLVKKNGILFYKKHLEEIFFGNYDRIKYFFEKNSADNFLKVLIILCDYVLADSDLSGNKGLMKKLESFIFMEKRNFSIINATYFFICFYDILNKKNIPGENIINMTYTRSGLNNLYRLLVAYDYLRDCRQYSLDEILRLFSNTTRSNILNLNKKLNIDQLFSQNKGTLIHKAGYQLTSTPASSFNSRQELSTIRPQSARVIDSTSFYRQNLLQSSNSLNENNFLYCNRLRFPFEETIQNEQNREELAFNYSYTWRGNTLNKENMLYTSPVLHPYNSLELNIQYEVNTFAISSWISNDPPLISYMPSVSKRISEKNNYAGNSMNFFNTNKQLSTPVPHVYVASSSSPPH